ncbi:S-adenosyl-L-methionine-dependent methyltransferase [Armillaria nabsnona]|nr:S-adenosyl-L-methionine-dependent methyltransferase [Armillaria nabsnona]
MSAASSKRDYPSSPDVHYVLPSDALEKQWLELQHALVKRALCDGKSILAPIVLKPGDRVLDSGTGSGAWVLSLAEVPSSVSLTAIDIQSKIFPGSFPPNVDFLLHSVTDLPSQWTDTFSLVNQRFLFTALTGPQWEVALQELHRVIGPGGWVQLVEAKAISGHMVPFSMEISNLWSAFLAHKGLLIDIVNRLPDMLTQAGFVNVLSETRALSLGQWAGQDGIDFRDDVTSVLSAIRGPLFEGGDLGLVSSEQEYDDLIACVRKEWDNGQEVSASTELTMMYAQKPFI